jgi:HAD superfamily hydrolase (TIGR01509 family)
MIASAPELAAVFFDLDGTLIESEDVWNDAVRQLAASRAAEATESLLARTRGADVTHAMTIVHKALGWGLHDPSEDAALISRWVADEYRRGITLRPGARGLLSRVRDAGIRTALVTSTYRGLVEIVLDTLGPANFDAVVCGDEVKLPKPDPEPYLTAARLLNVDIRACVAVEDSALGAASARASGCAVLLVGGLATTDADLAVRDLDEISPATLLGLVQRPNP